MSRTHCSVSLHLFYNSVWLEVPDELPDTTWLLIANYPNEDVLTKYSLLPNLKLKLIGSNFTGP